MEGWQRLRAAGDRQAAAVGASTRIEDRRHQPPLLYMAIDKKPPAVVPITHRPVVALVDCRFLAVGLISATAALELWVAPMVVLAAGKMALELPYVTPKFAVAPKDTTWQNGIRSTCWGVVESAIVAKALAGEMILAGRRKAGALASAIRVHPDIGSSSLGEP